MPLTVFSIYAIFKIFAQEEIWWNPLRFLDLGIHELGHWLTMGLGVSVSVVMGTLAQWSLPVIVILAFLKQREYFGICFCFSWLGLSIFHSSNYCASADTSPLVVGHIGNSEMLHDWYFMLDKIGWLDYSLQFGKCLWFLSAGVSLFGLITQIILLWWMWRFQLPPNKDVQ